MKKNISVLLILCLISSAFVGCSIKAGTADSPTGSDENAAVLNQQYVLPENPQIGDDNIDLTRMSSTMVLAQVYSLTQHPEEFIGKTIKLKGTYYSTYDEETEKNYFFAVISDATACCQQGLEFIWNGEHNFPDDYPEDYTEVEISGVFSSYEELGQTYYYISTDDLTTLSQA